MNPHDSWTIVQVGNYYSLEEARKVFLSICEDPWFKSDGIVKGMELVRLRVVPVSQGWHQ